MRVVVDAVYTADAVCRALKEQRGLDTHMRVVAGLLKKPQMANLVLFSSFQ